MSRGKRPAFVFILALFALPGCALSRTALTGLGQQQRDYYAGLDKILKENRQKLDSGLTLQLSADRTRERNILEWERDLQKAEVILEQRNKEVTGRQHLLELKLAELDLAAVNRVAALQTIDEERKQTILNLYDKIVDGVAALEKNNATILNYLDSNDAKPLLRSLDLDGIFRVIVAVQQLQSELAQTNKEAQEEPRKETDEIRQAIQRARDLLIKVYAK